MSSALSFAAADSAAPKRPRIVGIAHAAFFVSDMAKARVFYKDFLGFAEPFSLPRPNVGDLVWIKINDRQSIELIPAGDRSPSADRLYHVALEVDDAEAMRVYLASKGIAVPEMITVGESGDKTYSIKDPNGNTVEIVEYMKDGWTRREKGKFMPETRISKHLMHVGVIESQLDAAMTFYGEILGMKEFWRGSGNDRTLSWVNMQVPDGEDYLEFMLYADRPSLDQLRSAHHICLEVEDVAKAGLLLSARSYPSVKQPTPLKAGVNRKRQINYFDPDGTRIEVMEAKTVDGKPAPSSSAPPPVPGGGGSKG